MGCPGGSSRECGPRLHSTLGSPGQLTVGSGDRQRSEQRNQHGITGHPKRSWSGSSEQRVHSDLLVFRTFLYLAGDSGGFENPGSLPILFSSPLLFPSLHLLVHPLFLSSTDSVINGYTVSRV